MAGVLYAVDVVTKVLAVERLRGQPDVPLVGDLLVLHFTTNPGAAFSTGTEYTVVLSWVALVAVLVVLWLSRRVASVLWGVALGLLLAGIGGNLTDRLLREPGPFRGHVIDFLMLPNWPVFNIADMCINAGAALVLVQAFRGVRIDATREPERPAKRRRGERAGEESTPETTSTEREASA
ncbi:signal peptidase II [Nocardioides nanhaiensis]|uniref:signal peptidase II n=1 Tax=Nocardioides nanhaiensis TaxID=1476871 RepID=UPI0031E9185E